MHHLKERLFAVLILGYALFYLKLERIFAIYFCLSNYFIFLVTFKKVFKEACLMRGKKKIFLWGKTKLDIGFYKDLLNLATGNADKVYSLSLSPLHPLKN